MSARVLVIVDVQNDFVEGGALGVTGGHRVAAAISDHLAAHGDEYDLIVASGDHHRPDEDNGGHFSTDPDYADTWPVHCVAGTPGAAYAPELDTSAIDVHIRKGDGEPAYSAFEGRTDDGRTLAELIPTGAAIDVVGIATDHCVRATARDALALGGPVRVLTALCAGVAPDSSERALAELARAGAEIVENGRRS